VVGYSAHAAIRSAIALGRLDVREVAEFGDDLQRVRAGEAMSVVDHLGEDAAVV
jgi:hypothetical protein